MALSIYCLQQQKKSHIFTVLHKKKAHTLVFTDVQQIPEDYLYCYLANKSNIYLLMFIEKQNHIFNAVQQITESYIKCFTVNKRTF